MAKHTEYWSCARCGKRCERLTARGQKPRWCSERCRDAARGKGSGRPRRRRSSALVYVGPVPHRRGIVASIDLTPRRQRVWLSGPCAWCGETFTIIDQTAARYCSARCLKAAVRAARGDRFRISPRERQAIYERDGWICQLCDAPVDPDLPPSHRWAATLDHIECQSWALIPDHSPANLRLAHRMCNSMRGDESWTVAA